jgi:hypothetical protein
MFARADVLLSFVTLSLLSLTLYSDVNYHYKSVYACFLFSLLFLHDLCDLVYVYLFESKLLLSTR